MQNQMDGHHHQAAIIGPPPMGQVHNVGGRQLLLHRSGAEGTAVVFLPGTGMVGLDYLEIHDQISAFATSVLYDRAGTGWSDRVELPRTAAEVADELRDLLHAAGVAAPYLLVAHSLGGAYARRFAQRFPDEVAGLVSLEGLHEDWDTYMPEEARLPGGGDQVPGAELSKEVVEYLRGVYTQMYAQWPDSVRELLIERHISPEWLYIAAREGADLAVLADELRHGGDVPEMPFILLTGVGVSQELILPQEVLGTLNDGKRALYTAVAKAAPRGEHRVLEDAAHSSMHVDRPDAVVQAIRDLLDRIDS
jgi:pimeloyl-ACP methyl ester carboxylesterase